MLKVSTQNVIQLGFAFFVNFLAFNTQGFIEESVIESVSQLGTIPKHAGYYSLSIIYAFYTIGNLFAAQIINFLSAKWAMFIGALCYGAFQIGFLFLNETYLYISSAILGLGAALIWTGQGVYLSQNCTKSTSSRNAAILWGIHEMCLIGGGIFLFSIFTTSESEHIGMSTIKFIYSIFTALSVISALIFSFLREPVYKVEVSEKSECSSVLSLMFTKRMALLVVVFCCTGVEQSFWTGIYPTCISFTRKLGVNPNAILALNLICTGVGQCSAGILFGVLGDKTRKIGRDYIMILGSLINCTAFVLCGLNFPSDSSLTRTNGTGSYWEPNIYIALLIGALLGFADACWNTQLMGYLCETYPDKSSQAFAIFKLFESLFSCFAFLISSVISLHWLLIILIIGSFSASFSFSLVVRVLGPRKNMDDNDN